MAVHGGRRVPPHGRRRGETGGGAVFRTQQSPLRSPRLPRPADGSLRHLLLRRRRARDALRGANGRALVCAVFASARPHVHQPAADRPLREPSALCPDQRDAFGAKRGHRRADGKHQVPDCDALRPRPGRDRSRPRPRNRARLSDRYRQARAAERVCAAGVVHRGDGRIPVARGHQPEHGDVGARRGAAQAAAHAQAARQRPLLSLSIRTRPVVVPGDAVRRRHHRTRPAIEDPRRHSQARRTDRRRSGAAHA